MTDKNQASNHNDESKEELSLAEATNHVLEECRMVLPGIQALFGFQLIAVFNPTFQEKLVSTEKIYHLIAIGLVALAVILVMTTASYHRQVGPKMVSESFITLASRLLLWGMLPLALGTCLDFYLIARIILHHPLLSAVLAILLALIFFTFWFLLPRLKFLQQIFRD